MWEVLGMIFGQTEAWSGLGHDKDALQDFCRETIEFADNLFEQYAVFASTLQGASTQNRTEIRKMLLEQPRAKFTEIITWLRLRDEHLIASAVRLTVKILGRLREMGLQIQTDAAQYIEDTYTLISGERKFRTRTNLSMQQKAELQRALENHLGSQRDVIDVDMLDRPKKQMSIQGWASSARSSGASTPTSETSKPSRPGPSMLMHGLTLLGGGRRTRWCMIARSRGCWHNSRRNQAWDLQLQRLLKSIRKSKRASWKRERKRSKRRRDGDRLRSQRRSTPGAGSGVVGLGDLGREHDVKGQGVMVSSDEDSDRDGDDEDDDDGMGIFGRAKKKVERPDFNSSERLGLPIEQKAGPRKFKEHREARRTCVHD